MSISEIVKNYKLRFPWTEKDLNELVERYETRLFLTSEKIIEKLVNFKIIEKR